MSKEFLSLGALVLKLFSYLVSLRFVGFLEEVSAFCEIEFVCVNICERFVGSVESSRDIIVVV